MILLSLTLALKLQRRRKGELRFYYVLFNDVPGHL